VQKKHMRSEKTNTPKQLDNSCTEADTDTGNASLLDCLKYKVPMNRVKPQQ